MKKSVLDPMNPERVCWAASVTARRNDLVCGNSSTRAPHRPYLPRQGDSQRDQTVLHPQRANRNDMRDRSCRASVTPDY